LVDGGKMENRLDVCSTFEIMEVSKDVLEAWNLRKKFINPLEFSSITSY
jgi:hypothetical protein